jgi:cell division protein YceG involved in septum cleavage
MGVRAVKTTQQMFGKLERDLAATARMEREEAADRQRRIDQGQARLDESVTRREILEALESVASEYGCRGFPENEAIADAFRKLAEALS